MRAATLEKGLEETPEILSLDITTIYQFGVISVTAFEGA